MRKLFCLLISAFSCIGLSAQSDGYEPTTTWPYRYADFKDGAVMTREGTLMTSGVSMFNLNLANGRVHYVQDNVIMEADMSRIYSARIGTDVFINIGGRMYLVLNESDQGLVVALEAPDIDQMSRTDIGFGISSATASKTTTSLELLGIGNSYDGIYLTGQTYTQARIEKGKGDPLPIRQTLYLVVDGFRIDADKKSVTRYPGVDAAAAKDFFKSHKIKWSKPESLAQVVDFVYGQLHQGDEPNN